MGIFVGSIVCCFTSTVREKGTRKDAKLYSLMLESHCPEVDTRWSYECGILNFARNYFDISESTAEFIKMPTECHTIALEHNTNVARMYYEGNTDM